MPSVVSVGTALPDLRVGAEAMPQISHRWLGNGSDQQKLFERFVSSSQVGQRFFSIPVDDVLGLNGMAHRNVLFQHHAPSLGALALEQALERGNVERESLSRLVFTSCTCPAIPSVDALIIEKARLRPSIARVPIYQHGCAGGVAGLHLARDLARGGAHVALSSVELCSLVFQPANHAPSQLVGAALFGDGASCAIVSPDDQGLVFEAAHSELLPNTRHLMGYDIQDDGFHLRLDRDLPHALAGVATEKVTSFLRSQHLERADIDYWLFHPGGVKILDYLETQLEIAPDAARWSRQVLREVGNLSSSTVLFVLDAFMRERVVRQGNRVVMMGIGPGLTLELILFRFHELE